MLKTLFLSVTLACLSSAALAGPITGDILAHFEATGVGTYAGPVLTTAPGTIASFPGISTSGIFSVTYTDTTITILSAGGATSFSSGYAFNGIVFDLSSPTISTVVINGLSSLSGFTSANLSYTANQIRANLTGLTFGTDQRLVLDASSAVPEPSSVALLAAGLAILGAQRLRALAERA